MRPEEAKSAIAYDPALDEYCLLYPTEWTFKQTKVQPCHITLEFDYYFNMAEQWQKFLEYARANGDRIGKLWLKTVGLQLTTYELKECLNIKFKPTENKSNEIMLRIEFDCLQYDQYVKVNKDIRYETVI